MSAGALHSDHINYLILRYLQEKGHEAAATAFYTDWRRPAEYRDPEKLPFAGVVRRDELVSVIQEGLHYDELSVRVRDTSQRRFQWAGAATREGHAVAGSIGGPARNAHGVAPGFPPFENGLASSSRPSSSGTKRKGRQTAGLASRSADDFAAPAAKRQRRSEGSESAHVNGDREGMDVDAASASGDADEERDAVSPANAASPEPEIIEVPERYDSMDVATQTDLKGGTKTSAMSWKTEKEGSVILHSYWSPNLDLNSRGTLLIVGESLCRFYRIPEDVSDVQQVTHIEDPAVPNNAVVTACGWHPNGDKATCAIDTTRSVSGKQMSRSYLMDYSRAGSSSRYLELWLVDPPSVVMVLKYNQSGRYLLAARSNAEQGLLLIYPGADSTSELKRPIAWRIFPFPLVDATWVTEDFLIACGRDGVVHAVSVNPDADTKERPWMDREMEPAEIEMFGLKDTTTVFSALDVPRWDKLRADSYSQGVAAVCVEAQRIALASTAILSESTSGESTVTNETLPGHVTAIEFQPPPQNDQARSVRGERSLLAVTVEEGECVIYESDADKGGIPASLCALRVAYGPALALAWSPHGDHLAVAGTDLVQVWRTEDIRSTQWPFVTWRPENSTEKSPNGTHEQEEETISEPSLDWSADGESLCFAVDDQIHIIRFRPPLHGAVQPVAVNGHVTP